MKITIAIPTRNRLEYLKIALQSILKQDYNNWEVIVSDNASEENIQDYILSLNDSRIKYFRTDYFVSVTENWNNAFKRSTGDYVIAIGDDDCLIQESFSLIHKIATEHSNPELIFSNGLLYNYPGVVPDSGDINGHLCTIGNWNLWNSNIPKIIDPDQLRLLVTESMNFKQPFSYNMQVLTIHRSLINRLKEYGEFFQSPYPDFYAMTMLFQKAEKIVSCPYPVVVVGVSPKSYGGLLFNNKESVGIENLNISKEVDAFPELAKYFLPGSSFNSCWLSALRCAQKKFPASDSLKINFSRYRQLQINEFLISVSGKNNRTKKIFDFCKKLNIFEIINFGSNLLYVTFLGKFYGLQKGKNYLLVRKQRLNIHPNHVNYLFKKNYCSISEVLSEITPYNCEKHFL